MNDRLTALWDALWWLVPFSFVGAIFGDAIRKDVLTRRQRVAVGVFCLMLGPLAGAVTIKEWGWSEFAALGIAAVAPTVAYDVIGLAAAILHYARDNPDKLREMLSSLWPWKKP